MPGYIIAGPDAPDYRYAKCYADDTGLDMREVAFDAQGRETLSLLETVAKTVEAFEPAIVRPSLLCLSDLAPHSSRTDSGSRCAAKAPTSFSPAMAPLEHAFAQSMRWAAMCRNNASA